MFKRVQILLILALLGSSFVTLVSFDQASANLPANDSFLNTWARTDQPVADGTVNRTWMWGPQANTGPMIEPYLEAPGGEREVQYFDKSRMEINEQGASPGDLWYVTNGLLAWELISGDMQLGDNHWVNRLPANIHVAGDPGSNNPTYATFNKLLNEDPVPEGEPVIQATNIDGDVWLATELADYGVVAGHHVPETNQTVASPFWGFMNSEGPVIQSGGPAIDRLFENPFFATGLPITGPYWMHVRVAGDLRVVLTQCFERRCLTYTPFNPPGWEVEAGNIGQHYYEWRQEADDAPGPNDGDQGATNGEPDQAPPEISELAVNPDQANLGVDNTVQFSATITDQYGSGYPGAEVFAYVESGPHADTQLQPDPAITDGNGVATLSYVGTGVGTDTIAFTAPGIIDQRTASVTWEATDSSEPNDPDPGETDDSMLNPGSTVTGPNGVTVGAPEGVLDEPMLVEIETVSDPTGQYPFPEHLDERDIISDFYAVTSFQQTSPPNYRFLTFGIPVPDGVNPENAGIVKLAPTDPAGLEWENMQSIYDESSGLIHTIAPKFYGGYTWVLVEDGGLHIGSDELQGTTTLDYSELLSSGNVGSSISGFHVHCDSQSFERTAGAGSCTRQHADQTANALNGARSWWVDNLGFREPRATFPVVDITLTGSTPSMTIADRYLYLLSYQQNLGVGAFYHARNGLGVTFFHGEGCSTAGCFTSPNDSSSRHEMFHAIQWSYEAIRETSVQADHFAFHTLTEGTAAAAQDSIDQLRRHFLEPFPVTRRLFDPNEINNPGAYQYSSQDFWLYLAVRYNRELNYIIPLLEHGNVFNWDAGAISGIPSLSEAYWNWAKDHGFEKRERLPGPDFQPHPVPQGDTCEFNAGDGNESQHVTYIPGSNPGQVVPIGPWTSTIVHITLGPGTDNYSASIDVQNTTSSGTNFKVYPALESGTTACWDDSRDNSPGSVSVTGSSVDVYVLISNGSSDDVSVELEIIEE